MTVTLVLQVYLMFQMVFSAVALYAPALALSQGKYCTFTCLKIEPRSVCLKGENYNTLLTFYVILKYMIDVSLSFSVQAR